MVFNTVNFMEIYSRKAFQNDHNHQRRNHWPKQNKVENAYFSFDVLSALGADIKYVLGKNLD